MSKTIKDILVTWDFEGDVYNVRGFNIAVTPSGSGVHPDKDAITIQRAGKESFEYILRNVPLESVYDEVEDDYTYSFNVWIQALYDNEDSDWVNQGGYVARDDGQATIESKTGSKERVDNAVSPINIWKSEFNFEPAVINLSVEEVYPDGDTSKKSNIEINADEISLIVADLDGDLEDSQYTALQQTSEQINLRAEKTYVDDEVDRVEGKADDNSDFRQTFADLNLTANQIDATVGEVFPDGTGNTSSITQNANAITSEVAERQKKSWKYEGDWRIGETGQGFDFEFPPIPEEYLDDMILRINHSDLEGQIDILINDTMFIEGIRGFDDYSGWEEWSITDDTLLSSTSNNIIRIEHDGVSADWGNIYNVELYRRSGSASKIEQLANQYTVKINSDDKVTGFGLALEDGESEFAVLADKFIISDPDKNADDIIPFKVENGNTYIDTAFIKDASITSAQIENIKADQIDVTDAKISSAQIDDIKANQINVTEGKIQSAQIEEIQTTLLKVGSNSASFPIPKPEGGHLWHFDRSVVSTDGIKPESGAVYTIRPNEGKFGGAVAVEEGTENLVSPDPDDWVEASGASIEKLDSYKGRISNFNAGEDTDWARGQAINANLEEGEKYSVSLYLIEYEGQINIQVRTDDDIPQFKINPDGSYTSSNIDSYYYNERTGRIEFTFTSANTGDYSLWFSVYNQDYNFDYEQYMVIEKVQIEQKPFATSFVDGSRSNGKLEYKHNFPATSNWSITALFKGIGGTTNSYRSLFQMGSDDDQAYWKKTLPSNIEDNQWYFMSFVNEEGSVKQWIYNIDTDELIEDGTSSGTVDVDKPYDGELFVGQENDMSYAANGLFDELLILPYAVTEEEIKSWYNANAPFYDSESVVSGGNVQIDSSGFKAFSKNGTKTVDIESGTGNAFFRGQVIGAVYNE